MFSFLLLPSLFFYVTSDSNSAHQTSSLPTVRQAPSPSPTGEGAVLYIFNHLHTYHINFSSLLGTFEAIDNYHTFRKARAVCWCCHPSGGGDEQFADQIIIFHLSNHFNNKILVRTKSPAAAGDRGFNPRYNNSHFGTHPFFLFLSASAHHSPDCLHQI